MTDASSGTLQFKQHHLPGLRAGEYRLDVRQTITLHEAKDGAAPVARTIPAAITAYFAVAGNRFGALGNDLVQLYPADNAHGEYGRSFPHVVLANDTLPWARRPTSDPIPPHRSKAGVDDNVPSWLAVLLLTEDDGVPMAPVTRTVAALFPDPAAPDRHSYFDAGGNTPPQDRLDIGEAPSDPCQALDLPLALFWRIAPSLADLAVLSHVRLTSRSGKVVRNAAVASGGGQDVTAYAVVVGNRMLPEQPEKQCRAALVCLEGLSHLLPKEDGTPPDGVAPGGTIRLACLVSWQFISTGTGRHFEAMLSGLDGRGRQDRGQAVPDQLLRLPTPCAPPSSEAAQQAAQAMAMGYVPLGHHTRDGGRTMSWYRGPLTPYAVGRFVPDSFGSADAATGYDPDTGLFDTTYATAWQLGRLLAVGSKSFSVALHVWRRAHVRATVTAMHRTTLAQAAVQTASALPGLGMLGRFLTDSVPASGPAGAWPATPGQARAMLQAAVPDSVPDAVANWLGALGLLAGVPFHYLVPNEAMLPPESIRFFNVDPNWTSALIDGACSVGRAGSIEVRQDAAVRAILLAAAGRAARGQRAAALGQKRPDGPDAPLPPLCGFLLRSAAVGLWPNLQVNGYGPPEHAGEDGPPLDLLRFERLADADLVIGLFAGVQLSCLDLHEPAEGLHFGLDDTSDRISLRATTEDQGPIGSVLHDSYGRPLQYDVPMRSSSVLDAGALAIALGARGKPLPSSELGMQMLKGAARVRYVAGAPS